MHRTSVVLALYLVLCLMASGNVGAQLADSAWPKLRHDLGNTASTPTTCGNEFKIRWIHTASGEDDLGTPIIGPEGKIFVVSTNRGVIYGLNTKGTLESQISIGGTVKAVPAIGADGTLYVGNDVQKILYAIGREGKTKWTHYAGGSVGIDSPSLSQEGMVYFAAQSLFSLQLDGSLRWFIPTTFRGCPVIAPDGSVYITGGNKLFSISPANGYAKSVYEAAGQTGPVVMGTDGTMYFASSNRELHSVGRDGALRWKYTIEEAEIRESSVALGRDGTVYIGSGSSTDRKDYLYALDSRGNLKWKQEIPGVITTPALSEEGKIFLTVQRDADTGSLYVVDRDGREQWKYLVKGQRITPPVIGTDGTVYFCSDARLYAIATSNLPPVASAGPEQRVIYGEKVTLDGSHSLDPDGNIVSYEWNFGDGESASGPRVEHMYKVPSIYKVSLTVVDEYGAAASTTTTISVGKNQPPSLSALQDKTLKEGEELSFQLKASDPDGDPLIFSATNLPKGASLDPVSGAFKWTPGKGSANNYYGIKFTVTDQSPVPLTASQEITIRVLGENSPPTLHPVEGKTVKAGEGVRLELKATDKDGDTLTFAASKLPPGAHLDKNTGVFSWEPKTPGIFNIKFDVTDNGTPPLSDTKEVSINVLKGNNPPMLMLPGRWSLVEGASFRTKIEALDTDEDALTFTTGTLPAGAEFDPSSQTFQWTPPTGSAGSYTVRFTATDNGTPPMSATSNVTISVSPTGVKGPQASPAKEVVTTSEEPTPTQEARSGATPASTPAEIVRQLRIIKHKMSKRPDSEYEKSEYQEKLITILDKVIDEVRKGKYSKAQGILQKKVLGRMDGFVSHDKADGNDWIIDKNAQLEIHPLVKATIDALGKL